MMSLSKYWGLNRLIDRCTRRPANEEAWQEFVNRFNSTIHNNVIRAFDSRDGDAPLNSIKLSEKVADELVQKVYRRLVEDRCRLLKHFRAERPGSFYSFLLLVSVKVVSEYLRENREREASRIPGRVHVAAAKSAAVSGSIALSISGAHAMQLQG